jgi:alpha-glucuronidase
MEHRDPEGGLGEDGSELWLRYRRVADPGKLAAYRKAITGIAVQGAESSSVLASARDELAFGLKGLLGQDIPAIETSARGGDMAPGALIAGTPASSGLIREFARGPGIEAELAALGHEGFLIRTLASGGKAATLIASMGDAGVLYGAFRFLRIVQTGGSLDGLDISEKPRIGLRQLDHWETTRCYAGGNVWDWEAFPDRIDPKYQIYARANASIGINGLVLNNVNAGRIYLTQEYLIKEKALADLFRPYAIRVYLSANFSAPVTLGGLKTADPAEPSVLEWWERKCAEIYALIPDFGGFVVKANSEGEPGPKDYGRSHAEGANLLARAIAPHGGIILWRAFVYDPEVDPDRLKRSYKEFVPLDGSFEKNVFVQAKNGPLDFQPREPFNPLFGAMPKTPLAMEFQISQEYLGQSDHLVYLAPMWKEVLDADTFAQGPGSSVASVADGSLHAYPMSAIAAVANTGSDANWCGHHFHQANWHAFGRLAWDHRLSAQDIADEWARMTWGNDAETASAIVSLMMGSHEACVNYMTPLGLGHIMARDHHYGPQPDDTVPGHEDWSPTYYHKADAAGLGYDRSRRGSGLTAQYAPEVAAIFDDIDACPENLLCWFHHVPWTRKMKSGRTFWEELCLLYGEGVRAVGDMRKAWEGLRGKVDPERYRHVDTKLRLQEESAAHWRDVCLSYFRKFSGLPSA